MEATPTFRDSVVFAAANFKALYTTVGDSRKRSSIGNIPKPLHAEFIANAKEARMGHAEYLLALMDLRTQIDGVTDDT
tara:strand:- start:8147 stop:8380 length:234 start_codon:yes stop_codon:yes gene_type:complete